MGNAVKYLIPDSVELAQYDAKLTIEEVAGNLADKYKKFAAEIKKIVESILKQNTENQNQISFRLGNKLLLEENETLTKFLNDDSFSPDIDQLVTTACDEAIDEISTYASITRDEVKELKEFLVDELKSANDLITETRKKTANEAKEKILNAQKAAIESKGSQSIGFDSFEGLRYFTGWLTASFITKFETNQIAAFNNIGQTIGSIESVFENISTITEQVKKAGGEEQVKETVKIAKEQEKRATPIDLGNTFGAKTVTMIMQLRSRQNLQNKAKNLALAGLKGMASGLLGVMGVIGKAVADIGIKIVKKTVEMSAKLLKGIVRMTVWTVDKLFNNIFGWSLAAVLIWKYWLGDKFKATVTDWVSKWFGKINEKLKIDKLFNYVKEYYIEKIYNRYIKKFADYYKEKWAAPLENLKTYLTSKIKPMIQWVSDVKKKIADATYEKFETAINMIQDSWAFTKKVLNKPFDSVIKSGGDMFDAIKATGDWIWGLMTGKLSWKEAGEQFSNNVWHPVVEGMHSFIGEVTNFAKINGNWILDFFGVTDFRFENAVDKNGNVITGREAMSVFDKLSEGIMGFGREKKEIILDENSGSKLIIDPAKLGKGAVEGGVIFTWSGHDKEKSLKIFGVDNATAQLNQLAKDIKGMTEVVAGGAMVFAGGLIGAWVGRIVGLIVTVVSAAFTGGAALAGAATAMNIGGNIGNILGSLIGYFFFNSLTESKEYFLSPANENVAERLGVTKEAANTLKNTWEMPDFSRMAGRVAKDEVDSLSSGMPFTPTIKPIDTENMSEKNKEVFNQMNFNENVYSQFSKMFSMAAGNPSKLSESDRTTRTILVNAMANEGERFSGHFDRNIESILKMDVNDTDLAVVLGREAAGTRNLSEIVSFKNGFINNPAESYKKLTVTGNPWIDMMLQNIISQNKVLSYPSFEQALKWNNGGAAGNARNGTLTGLYVKDGHEFWAVIPIVRSLLSIRMALVLFQTKIQKEVQRSIMLFNKPLDGEEHLMMNIQRMLLDTVYEKSEDDNKKFANAFWNNLQNNLWNDERGSKYLLESTRILFNKLRENQENFINDDTSNFASSFFDAICNGEHTRIKNILATIQPYADILQGTLKLNDNTTLTRDEMSNILLTYPNAIGMLLSSGEIGEAFSSITGEPANKLKFDDQRISHLKTLFNTVDNSLIEAMNEQLTNIFNNFDELSKTDNAALKRQLEELLSRVQDTDWVNKIKEKVRNGLVFKSEYDSLFEKFDKLQEELNNRSIRWLEGENGVVITFPYNPDETLGSPEAKDSKDGLGTQYPLSR